MVDVDETTAGTDKGVLCTIVYHAIAHADFGCHIVPNPEIAHVFDADKIHFQQFHISGYALRTHANRGISDFGMFDFTCACFQKNNSRPLSGKAVVIGLQTIALENNFLRRGSYTGE